MNSSVRKSLVYLFFLLLAVVMMWYLYRNVSWTEDVLPGIRTANWFLVVLSFGLGYLATVIRGLRWNVLLEPLGYKANNWTNIHSVAFGYCMNNLVPRSGELARCTLLNRAEKIPVDRLIGTVIMERIVDLMLLAIVLFAAFVLNADALRSLVNQGGGAAAETGDQQSVFPYILFGCVLLLTLAIAIFRRYRQHVLVLRIKGFLFGIWDGLKSITRLKKRFLFFVYSVGIWACWVLMTYTIMQALESTRNMTLSDTIFFIGAGSLGMIVPTPGGAGAFHGIAELAFAALGYDRKVGKVFALISWSGKTAFDILVGAVGFIVVTARKIKV